MWLEQLERMESLALVFLKDCIEAIHLGRLPVIPQPYQVYPNQKN